MDSLIPVETPAHTFTAQELAGRLGVHERTVRRWISQGRLPAAKHGASFAIRVEDAEALAGSSLHRKMAARAESEDRDLELVELQGRYKELKEMVTYLERELAEERRHAARLEVRLEMQSAA